MRRRRSATFSYHETDGLKMSETNGNSGDRLERLEASHVRLMTEHELFVKEHEKFVATQALEWKRQKKRWRKSDLQRQEDYQREQARGAALDMRIEKLVSGLGQFIRERG
jgi:hypothetical protein